MATTGKRQPASNVGEVLAGKQRQMELLSRDEIQSEYNFSKRWLELAALSGDGPPMIRISARMVRYQRGVFEDWLATRTVNSTSEQIKSA